MPDQTTPENEAITYLHGALQQLMMLHANVAVIADLEHRLGQEGVRHAEVRVQVVTGEIKLVVKAAPGGQQTLLKAIAEGIAARQMEAFHAAAVVLSPNSIRYDPKYTLLKDGWLFFTMTLNKDERAEDMRQVW